MYFSCIFRKLLEKNPATFQRTKCSFACFQPLFAILAKQALRTGLQLVYNLRITLLDLFLTVQWFRFQKNCVGKFYAEQSKVWDWKYFRKIEIILEWERLKPLTSCTNALITILLLSCYLGQQPEWVKHDLSLARYLDFSSKLFEGKTILSLCTGGSWCSNLCYKQMGVVGIYYSIILYARKGLIWDLMHDGGWVTLVG